MKTLALLLLSATAFASPVHVRSTLTKRGVVRQQHMRSSPDHTQRNNYSSRGNVNAYTGKTGHRTPKY